MQIVFLLSQSLERPSGLGRYWPMSRTLAAHGHQVTVLALHPDWKNLAKREFVRDGVKVQYVGPMHIRQSAAGKVYYNTVELLWIVFQATMRLAWHALRTPADVIIVGKAQPMNGLAGMIGHRLRRIPLWLDCDDYEAGSNRFAGRWQHAIVAQVETYLIRQADRISVNTCFMQNYAMRHGVPPGRISLIPNGVDRERFASVDQAAVEELRQQFGLSDRRCIVYIGSLSLVNHAVDLLLDAFAIVSQSLPDVKLLVVGGGEDYDSLRAQAERLALTDRVCFAGVVPSDRVPSYYRVADVSVDPVHNDEASQARSPLKLFESWAAGVPFVTADVGDRRRYIGANEAGVLVKADEAPPLAEGLLQVLSDRALADRLTRVACQRLEDYYWDRLTLEWLRGLEMNEQAQSYS